MRYKKVSVFISVFAFAIMLFSNTAFANKSAVSIQAPAEAPSGSEVVIRVTVTHNANSFLHHTEWLYIMVNGQEVARWKYKASERPEAEIFTKEIKYTATDNLEIKAEASCNLHGSAGPATVKVLVKD
jgi:desulfoferrodoxin (superoxide reductase-like protein)